MQTKNKFQTNQLETRYNFARQVRLLRESNGLSTKEFAQELNVGEKYILQIELGKFTSLSEIFALARYFDKKVEINLV